MAELEELRVRQVRRRHRVFVLGTAERLPQPRVVLLLLELHGERNGLGVLLVIATLLKARRAGELRLHPIVLFLLKLSHEPHRFVLVLWRSTGLVVRARGLPLQLRLLHDAALDLLLLQGERVTH